MSFDTLRAEIMSCTLCADAFGFLPHPVCWGNERARILQVGQAPSSTVHETRRPFDDASGRKLRGQWYQISDEAFYDPDNFYMTSIGHCYPGKSKGGGDKPPPLHCARRWLTQEIELVQSRIIVLIGGSAARFFFPKVDFATLVFADHIIGDRPAYVLPHPSPLNIKWFKDHPQFLDERIAVVRQAVQQALAAEAPIPAHDKEDT